MYTYKSKVKVSAHDAYEALIDSLEAEYEQATGNKMTKEKLEQGVKYKKPKKEGKKMEMASVHIKKPIKDKLVLSTYAYKQTTYEMRYDIVAIDDNTCEITYTQSSNPEVETSAMSKRMTDRNMRSRFKQIAKYVKDKENGKYDEYFKTHDEETSQDESAE